ncbi:TerC family protein [Rhizobium paknamense]|uniref:Tellurite resistance protein TerC n=1 Tax=Rhizobium paknamense TaxID=1206817 RepID=A0ABU0ICP1_9HYPH|nr:TerC family protein [Rhizobium paknamense]MDQ0455004.1 tellurite resistance protein TerC [Rhizobium paknamense]
MEWITADFLGQPLWMWLGFLTFVFILLVIDLGLLSAKSRHISVAQSMKLSAFYIAMGIAFGGFIWWRMGHEAAVLYLTGYVVEESLSLDNIFVIALIFGYFKIPQHLQHRALVYGIIGVVVLRGIMVAAGTAIVDQFHWVLYVFAAFLVYTGIKMLLSAEEEYDVAGNPILRFLHRHLPITEDLHGEKFFVRLPQPGDAVGKPKLFATPLFLALVMVEFADVIFAVDSVPAIFSITTDPYLVFTSNIAAILGLRALYFALSAMLERFVLLKYALSAVLIFIGGKILAGEMLGLGKMPPLVSLVITLAILSAGVIGSLLKTKAR